MKKQKWLQELRSKKDLNHSQVSEIAGIKRPYYTMIENGTRIPSVGTAKKIASALDFDWTIFFDSQCNERKH